MNKAELEMHVENLRRYALNDPFFTQILEKCYQYLQCEPEKQAVYSLFPTVAISNSKTYRKYIDLHNELDPDEALHFRDVGELKMSMKIYNMRTVAEVSKTPILSHPEIIAVVNYCSMHRIPLYLARALLLVAAKHIFRMRMQ